MSRFIFRRSKEKGAVAPLKVVLLFNYYTLYVKVISFVPSIVEGSAWKLVSREITSSIE
jgi:hypothetical protein